MNMPQRRRRDPGGDARAEEAADQAGRRGDRDDVPVDGPNSPKITSDDRRGDRRERRLQRVGQLEPVQRDAEDADQDHAERAAEVAAVDGGEEQRHVQPGRVAAGVVVLVPLSRRVSSGWTASSRLASSTSTGTTTSNAADGVVSSSTLPVVPPRTATTPNRISRLRWPSYSARKPATPPR